MRLKSHHPLANATQSLIDSDFVTADRYKHSPWTKQFATDQSHITNFIDEQTVRPLGWDLL